MGAVAVPAGLPWELVVPALATVLAAFAGSSWLGPYLKARLSRRSVTTVIAEGTVSTVDMLTRSLHAADERYEAEAAKHNETLVKLDDERERRIDLEDQLAVKTRECEECRARLRAARGNSG